MLALLILSKLILKVLFIRDNSLYIFILFFKIIISALKYVWKAIFFAYELL
jgi:hypothetical protein